MFSVQMNFALFKRPWIEGIPSTTTTALEKQINSASEYLFILDCWGVTLAGFNFPWSWVKPVFTVSECSYPRSNGGRDWGNSVGQLNRGHIR